MNLPYNMETEKYILGCLLIDKSREVPTLKDDDFNYLPNKVLFESIQEVHNKGQEVDIITVSEVLECTIRNNQVTFELFKDDALVQYNAVNINQSKALEILTQYYDNIITTESYNSQFKKLKELSFKRDLLRKTYHIQQLCNDDMDSYKLLNESKKVFEALEDNTPTETILTADKCMDEFLNMIEKNQNTFILSSGFTGIDEILEGGLYPGLYCIGAGSSTGKTTLCLQLCDNVASQGKYALYFSLEMARSELMAKSISREMFLMDPDKCKSIGTRKILQGNFNETIFAQALKVYEKKANSLSIIEGDINPIGVMDIWETAELYRRAKKNIGLIVVDYLQILKPYDMRLNDKQNTDMNISTLKKLSRKFNIPIIVISSFNRANYTTPVSFESFKESGGIEYSADVLIGLQFTGVRELNQGDKKKAENNELLNQWKARNPREIEFVVLKQRNGSAYAITQFKYYPISNLFVGV